MPASCYYTEIEIITSRESEREKRGWTRNTCWSIKLTKFMRFWSVNIWPEEHCTWVDCCQHDWRDRQDVKRTDKSSLTQLLRSQEHMEDTILFWNQTTEIRPLFIQIIEWIIRQQCTTTVVHLPLSSSPGGGIIRTGPAEHDESLGVLKNQLSEKDRD